MKSMTKAHTVPSTCARAAGPPCLPGRQLPEPTEFRERWVRPLRQMGAAIEMNPCGEDFGAGRVYSRREGSPTRR